MQTEPSEPLVTLERARQLYARREWREACRSFRALDECVALEGDDLERLAWAAALAGEDAVFLRALERLHEIRRESGELSRAALAAFWLGFRLLGTGEPGKANGWLSRAHRLVERETSPCAVRGYLSLPAIFGHLGKGENALARDAARDAVTLGEQCGDADLVALARNLEGRALLRQGRCAEGLALLDETMLAVTSGALSDLVTGLVYCNVIATCQQVHAIERAWEWTSALTEWCRGQPGLVTFTGNCRVLRSELLLTAGRWSEALEEIERICARTASDKDPEVFADACYHRAEVHRLRGEFSRAESWYRAASDAGRDPQPGLASLRLAQGQRDVAGAAIRRVLQTTEVPWVRAGALPVIVEIALAEDELSAAEQASAELREIADRFGTPAMRALAERGQGALELARGDAEAAIPPLRRAFAFWNRMPAPYEAARTRVLLGRAFLALGDREGGELEVAAARATFAELGAAPELAALPAERGRDAFGLSKREREVLCLVATGKTNRGIAQDLCISERTVDRHVSNILVKLDVSSRTAATAFAYEHAIV